MGEVESELKDFIESRIGLPKVTDFVCRLRTLGLCGREAIQQVLPELSDKQQYIAATALSFDELENSTTDVLDTDGTQINADETNFPSACVSFDRTVVLMNDPVFGTHGETRLLGPKRIICQQSGFGGNHLEKMTQLYKSRRQEYVIVLFSHLIPCTVPRYNCSKLIRDYVTRTGEHVIVAYENLYRNTNVVEALNNLGDQKNIYVLERSSLNKCLNDEKQMMIVSRNIAAVRDNINRQLEWRNTLNAQQFFFAERNNVGSLWKCFCTPYTDYNVGNFEHDSHSQTETEAHISRDEIRYAHQL